MSGIILGQCNNNSDISVLGYSSKIFRDDEKALELEQGKHLMSWMGDSSITIDRFDVRAYLTDLSQLDVGQQNKMNVEGEEIEELCEHERYKALLDFEGEEYIYKEESQKRTNHSFNEAKKYSQVSYDYEGPDKNVSTHCSALEVTDSPFEPNPELEIPSYMVIPTSSNLNKIIEKTATYVLKHGMQMEIFIKARQSNNNKFNFMNFKSDLYPYYQLVLNKMKPRNYNENGKHIGNVSSDQFIPNYTSCLDVKELAPGANLPALECCPYNMLVDKIQSINKDDDKFKLSNLTTNIKDVNFK